MEILIKKLMIGTIAVGMIWAGIFGFVMMIVLLTAPIWVLFI